MPPVAPMLAKSVKAVPDGPGYLYEPKWDGFRCIVFRDGDEVELGSRNERPMTRYFPDVVDAVRAQLPERCVVDAEIVVPRGDRLDFEALLQRIHPADSRVRLLAEQTPASLVIFDLLALGDESLMDTPLAERRRRLDEVLAGVKPPVHRTLVTDDAVTAREWFASFEGAGLDGVVAKPVDLPYEPDRRVMLKVKHERTADCVVAGFRWHKSGPVIGSLLRVGGAGRGPDARRAVPVEREEGPVLGAAAARAGDRGPVRPHGRDAVPAHHPVRPVAGRPGPPLVHVRPAGGAGQLRPGNAAGLSRCRGTSSAGSVTVGR